MKPARCAAFALFTVVGGALAYSQGAAVPFHQIQRDAQLQTLRAANDPDSAVVMGALPSSLPAGGLVSVRPASPVNHRILDRYFFLLNGVHLGMAVFDVEMTQHCMAEHKCQEGNPIMPSSHAGQIGVSFGFVAYTAAGSYWMKKHKSKIWWAPSAAGIAAHAAGLATGFVHR